MPPVPSGPGSMNLHAHQRRESTHSAHAETGPHLGHGQRGAMRDSRGGGRHQGYQNNHQYNQQNQYNNGYGRGGYGGPNQNRGPPPNMNQQQGYGGPNPIQGYPNSPRNIHRSPAITHASPSLAAVTPMATPQLFPQQHYMPQPGNVSYLHAPFSLFLFLAVCFLYFVTIFAGDFCSGKSNIVL